MVMPPALAPYMTPHSVTWAIIALSILGVIARPFKWPEFIWAASGAMLLVALHLLSPAKALDGILKGLDIYLFLIGMMAVADVARKEGLFDWLVTLAVRGAKGSASRLFALVYAVGIVVTIFLSSDATAVVLTPAVYAAAKAAKAEPLPYLSICALIANAASFVLPISNPANSSSSVITGRRSQNGSSASEPLRLPRWSSHSSSCAGRSASSLVRRSRPTSRPNGSRRAAGSPASESSPQESA